MVARAAGTSGEDGIGFFVVDGDASGLTRTPLATMDQTRKQARLDFDGVAARPLGDVGDGWAALSKTLDQAAVAHRNESIGGAQKCLDMAVEYAEGARAVRPADRLVPGDQAQVRRHAARGGVGEVGRVLRGAGPRPRTTTSCPVVASLAKAYCSDAYFHAAAENIQIHGGIGFTWEHDAHLYFKRAKSSEILLGDATYHRELLAQRIGI